MRRRAGRLATGDRTVVDDDDFLAGFHQQIRRRQPRDAGPDDADVGASIARESGEIGDVGGVYPQRACLTGIHKAVPSSKFQVPSEPLLASRSPAHPTPESAPTAWVA